MTNQTTGANTAPHWQPERVSSITERGPLPKHLSLPYLDKMRLVADAEKIAIKEVSGLARELIFFKFIGTWGGIFFAFSLFVMYLILAIAHKTIFVNPVIFKLTIPLISACLIIRQTSIFLEKKYVKKTNFAPVIFNRKTNTLSITHGWKRQKLETTFDYVHAYIRYLPNPAGLTRPKLLLKIFDEQAPHKVKMNYFLNLGPDETEYKVAAQWSVICQFMDTNRDYPYNPQFWDAGVSYHYPEDFKKYQEQDIEPSEESQDYYGERLMDYALDQNAMGLIGVEKEAGLKGLFADHNPYKRTKEDVTNRLMDIIHQTSELERQFGIPFPLPPVGLWCQEP